MAGFEDTIEKLKAEIAVQVNMVKTSASWSQVDKLYRALGTIEELAEIPRTSLADLFGFAEASVSAVSVRPGEFIGMDALPAAKLYLEKKKTDAASLDEIIEAITKGGANSISRDALRTSLGRSTWDVVKAPDQELYQLIKFAPHVKRGKKKSVQTEREDVQAEPSAEPTEKEVIKE